MDAFGLTLKRFRMAQGITQELLADLMGVSRNTIVNWETRTPPSRENVLKLAEVLYLDDSEKDELLSAAGYSPTYHIRKPGRCDYYAHISLPPIYVERPQLYADIRTALLSDMSTAALSSTLPLRKPQALHGMGGIGKTVIVRALCDDPMVQAAFSDGILWVTLGQTPDLALKMREWINTLGGAISETASTIDGLKETLAKLLKERTCLLIVDDVWQRTHVEAFRVDAPRCRLLLVTRDAQIASAVGAEVHSTPVMTSTEAVALLEAWANGRLTKVDTGVKSQIVKRLGGLPLAVKLAGGRLQDVSIDKWLGDFEELRDLDAEFDANNPEDSLYVSFMMSLQALKTRLRDLYITLGVFRENEAIPEHVIEKLWGEMDEVRPKDTTRILNDLANKALIEMQGIYPRHVALHDLLRQFVYEQLEAKEEQVHGALLGAYRKTQIGGWHTVPDDGYLYNHLAYHLNKTQNYEELKALFADQQWMHARVRQGKYSYEGYASDLRVVLEHVTYKEILDQVSSGVPPTAFADFLRYLLLLTSLNSIAENHHAEIVRRAVETGLWSADQAFANAVKIRDAIPFIYTSRALLLTEKLDVHQSDCLQEEALKRAMTLMPAKRMTLFWAFSLSYSRPWALGILVPALRGKWREEAIALGLEEVSQLSWVLKAQASAMFAPYCDEHQREAVLSQALERVLEKITIEVIDVASRPLLIAGESLIPYLTTTQIDALFQKVLRIENADYRAYLIDNLLAPFLTEEQQDIILSLLPEIHDEKALAAHILAVAPYAHGTKCLEAALQTSDEDLRIRVLVASVQHMNEKQRQEAFQEAIHTNDMAGRAYLLVELLPYLQDAQKEYAISEAFSAIPLIENQFDKVNIGCDLTKYLDEHRTESLLGLCLQTALNAEEGLDRISLLLRIAPISQEPQRDEILRKALNLAISLQCTTEVEGNPQVKAITLLAPQLPELLVKVYLEHVLTIPHTHPREYLLSVLAPFLKDNNLEVALKYFTKIQIEPHKNVFLCMLTHYVRDEEKKSNVLGKSLDEAALMPKGSQWEQLRVAALLTSIVPYYSGGQQRELIQQARDLLSELIYDIGVSESQKEVAAKLFANLLPYLHDGEKLEAIERALEQFVSEIPEDARILMEMIYFLLPHLSQPQIERVKQTAVKLYERKPVELYFDNQDRELFGTEPFSGQEIFILIMLLPYLDKEESHNWYCRLLKEKPFVKNNLLHVVFLTKLAAVSEEHEREELVAEALRLCLPSQNQNNESLLKFSLELFHAVDPHQELLASLRKALIDSLLSMAHVDRDTLFSFCCDTAFLSDIPLLAPPLLAEDILQTIAEHVIEICEEWEWG
jgi:transcriptional regulator with XRE-family HTH domain